MATNRKLPIIPSLLVVLMFASSAQAQTGDWQAVQNLKPGTLISVKVRHRFLCSLEHATENELVCEVPEHRLSRLPPRITIPRGEVREVRLAHNQAKDGAIGAGIGAGVGAAVGANTGTGSRGAGASIGALGGAAIGAVVGTTVPIFRRGRIIYKR